MVNFSRLSIVFLLLLLIGCQPGTPLPTAALPKKSAPPAVAPVQAVIRPLQPLSSVVQPEPVQNYELTRAPELPPNLARFLQPEPRPLPYYGDFPLSINPQIAAWVKLYSGAQKKVFAHWLARAARYIPRIQMIFAAQGIPLDLAYLAMIESGFNVRAYSWAHAAGPWQFIESTGKLYGLKNDWWHDSRLDLEKSTLAAARHLNYLHQRFEGDWYLAVAAYNAGCGSVSRAIKSTQSRDFWVLSQEQQLRRETRDYVPKLLAALTIISKLEDYGFDQLEFDPPLVYEVVSIPSATDLEVLAQLGNLSYAQLKDLNPELKRWCTPPGHGSYPLRVPPGSAALLAEGYARLPQDQRARYRRHQIQAGETLNLLAKKYRIRVDDIIALNKIRNPRNLQIGANLILPLQAGVKNLPHVEQQDFYVRGRRTTYQVKNGDSLWSIARRFNVSENELRIWNKLGWSNLISPGQVLTVSAPKERLAKNKARDSGGRRKLVYEVAPGDTLWGIGRQFDVAAEAIRRWNSLANGHILRPGQKLTLMVSDNRSG